MIRFFVAMEDELLVVSENRASWRVEAKLHNTSPQCIAIDPLKTQRIYCGTFRQGLWRSDDNGATWKPAGKGITNPQITSIAVSTVERKGQFSTAYVGTEPSTLLRSEDGGDTCGRHQA